MCRSFEKAFAEFVNRRSIEDFRKVIITNSDYKRFSQEAGILLQKLEALALPADHDVFSSFMDEYNNAINSMEVIAWEIVYIEGLKDGFKLRKILSPDETRF